MLDFRIKSPLNHDQTTIAAAYIPSTIPKKQTHPQTHCLVENKQIQSHISLDIPQYSGKCFVLPLIKIQWNHHKPLLKRPIIKHTRRTYPHHINCYIPLYFPIYTWLNTIKQHHIIMMKWLSWVKYIHAIYSNTVYHWNIWNNHLYRNYILVKSFETTTYIEITSLLNHILLRDTIRKLDSISYMHMNIYIYIYRLYIFVYMYIYIYIYTYILFRLNTIKHHVLNS